MESMSRRRALQCLAAAGAAATRLPHLLGQTAAAPTSQPAIPPAPEPIVPPAGFGIAKGPYQPTFESLSDRDIPDWYRDAKFGIWAHWGPQCQPEMGDWYAQRMYQYSANPTSDYQFHLKTYGHPSTFGFKDVINEWKADKWDPVALIALYKRAGAKFFASMANHHDNMDMFDSTYQPWNSVRIGPKKDIVGGWAKAARGAGLRFAISSHASHTWDWIQASRNADPAEGPKPGVPYDGLTTKAQGKGKWWEGLDPQDLYAQYHERGRYQWTLAGNPPLDQAYKDKFFYRTIDLINKYQPDLLYFDDTVLPMIGADPSVGLRIAAYLYNTSAARNGGKVQAVMTGKGLNADQRKAILLDLERAVTGAADPIPWQTDTCIGDWHYRRSLFDQHRYKTPTQVIQMLIDIVSKNGNLMLNIPLPGNGMPDDDEMKLLAALADWIAPNGEGIYETRPWAVYGEGPATIAPVRRGMGSDVRAYTADDVRFTRKGGTVYAFLMGWPDSGKATLKSLAANSENFPRQVAKVELMGGGEVKFTRDATGLTINMPDHKPNDFAYCLKITPA